MRCLVVLYSWTFFFPMAQSSKVRKQSVNYMIATFREGGNLLAIFYTDIQKKKFFFLFLFFLPIDRQLSSCAVKVECVYPHFKGKIIAKEQGNSLKYKDS